jgi:hypothetical protein
VTHSTHLGEVIATRMPEDQAGVRVVRRQTDASRLVASALNAKYELGKGAMKLGLQS